MAVCERCGSRRANGGHRCPVITPAYVTTIEKMKPLVDAAVAYYESEVEGSLSHPGARETFANAVHEYRRVK